jgi:hypothetical protein
VVNSEDRCSGTLDGGNTPSNSGCKLHFYDSEYFVKMDPRTKQ